MKVKAPFIVEWDKRKRFGAILGYRLARNWIGTHIEYIWTYAWIGSPLARATDAVPHTGVVCGHTCELHRGCRHAG